MIVFKQVIAVTRDDPMADYYKNNLKKENGWIAEEDTTCIVYSYVLYCKSEVKDEEQHS